MAKAEHESRELAYVGVLAAARVLEDEVVLASLTSEVALLDHEPGIDQKRSERNNFV